MNNREYTSDAEYESDELARDAAATRAYLICRHFSVNDGMIPGQRQGQGGVVQGLPVAIGTGRRRTAGSQGSGGDANGSEQGSGSSSGSDSGRSNSSSRAEHRLSDGDSSITSVDASISSISSKASGSMGNIGRNKSRKSCNLNGYEYSGRTGTRNSGGSSPRSSDSGFYCESPRTMNHAGAAKKMGMNRAVNLNPDTKLNMNMSQRQGMGMPVGDICYCGQAVAQLYGRCGNCLRQSGWQ